MAYGLNEFCRESHDALARDNSPAGREVVRKNLEKLLTNQEFVEEVCGKDAPVGVTELYRDDELEFVVLAAARSRHFLGDLRTGQGIYRHERVQPSRRRGQRW